MVESAVRTVRITTGQEVVGERVSVRPLAGPAAAYLLKPDAEWTWSDLRDYVLDKIREVSGRPAPRDPAKEKAIFSSFLSRYQEFSGMIARHAFEGPDAGWWRGAVIGMNRFCRGSDPFFADVIVGRLVAKMQAEAVS